LLWAPWNRIDRLLDALRHEKTLRGNIGKASCALLLPVPDACQTNLLMAKFGLDEACCDSLCDFFFLRLLFALDSFRPDTYAGAPQIA